MDSVVLTDVADEQIAAARAASNGRSVRTMHGGRDHVLRQMVLALAAGHMLDEHENPGEATVQVLVGRVHLSAGEQVWNGAAGHYVTIPPRRHHLVALDDSAIFLTVLTAPPHSR